ncbi:MAG: twin-arginine translocase subunit TatC [Chloroflexota bacterium]
MRNIWRAITFPFRLIFSILRWLARSLGRRLSGIRAFFTEEVEDAPVGEALSKAWDQPSDLLVHLDALRKHLFRAVLALIVTTGLAFTYFDRLLDFLARPLPGGAASLQAIEVTEPISTVMRVSLFAGFALAFPYIALELWLFIGPGLSRRSRLAGLLAIPIATLFFIGGMAFAYYVMMPTALPFLLNFMGINTLPRPSNYVKFVTSLLFWIGVAFEFPLVIFLLAKLGFVRPRTLAQQWRLAVVIIAVVSAMITPTIDPVNMGLVMLPMIGLYFLSIILAVFAAPKREQAPG